VTPPLVMVAVPFQTGYDFEWRGTAAEVDSWSRPFRPDSLDPIPEHLDAPRHLPQETLP